MNDLIELDVNLIKFKEWWQLETLDGLFRALKSTLDGYRLPVSWLNEVSNINNF